MKQEIACENCQKQFLIYTFFTHTGVIEDVVLR